MKTEQPQGSTEQGKPVPCMPLLFGMVQFVAGLLSCSTAIGFVLACAAAPLLILFWSHDWYLGPEQSGETIACVLLGNVTGLAGLLFVSWIADLVCPGESK